nr:STAS domain-containing protein [Acidobacteriota bacterium]
MDSPLRITQRTAAPGVTVLDVAGRLVFSGGEESLLRNEVAARVGAGDRKLLVDLSNVTYIDSGGVGSLVTAYLHTVRRGGQLKLVCPNERVCRVLTITHLSSV